MQKIAIVHYLPIENYPPITNLLNFVSENKIAKYCVYTTRNTKDKNNYSIINVTVNRFKSVGSIKNSLLRLLTYYNFNVKVFLKLIWQNPEIVLYYESYSAMPVYWYIKLFGKDKKLWMHTHEYFPKDWYETGMKTVKYYHKKEVEFLYNRANGLSETNEFRVDLFLKDYPFVNKSKVHILQNFPPLKWYSSQRDISEIKTPIKTLYIGSVSLRATYLKEYCNWVLKQNGNVLFDIFTNNFDIETQDYMNSISSPFIKFNTTGIAYDSIPETISKNQYHVGVIIYKGIYLNTAWCASNKLFEYLACGLDVWFTKDMPGTYPYITQNTYPRVCKVDFNNLNLIDFENLITRENHTYKPFHYNCEEVYEEFYEKLISN